ncbi:hypothetical protein [Streptococcus sp. zg-JUN1979]|uniref:tetratricopeptide repeat protein n=1 Tax=Streptococcus sp. zg-JUN1979 TaxID=3391450 RepID=UPI0039A404E1
MSNSEKMLVALEQQDLKKANQYLEKALREDESSLLLELAEYLESIGFLQDAKRIYLALREDYPHVAINLAQIAAEDGAIEEAFLYLEGIPEDSDDYVTALVVMADLYDMEGLDDVAHDKLVLAHSISDDPLITLGLAELELGLGRFEEALKHYASLDNRMILEQTGISTYQRIGRIYASLGKFEAAAEFLEKSVEIAYDDQTVFELATLLYDMTEYQKAALYFKQLDTINPDFAGYEYPYALTLRQEHQLKEALRLVQQGLGKNSFDGQLLLLASQLSYENHDSQAAERYLLKAKELVEDDEEVLMRLTNLYLEQERYEEVVALDKEGIDNVLTKWNIARSYRALEEEDKAYELYQDVAKDLADNPDFLKDYAYLLHAYGYQDKARELAERYLTYVADDMEMHDFVSYLRKE